MDLAKIKIVTIKTVVNVVYKTDEQNISDAQIKSQIKAMNKDFRATNPDKSQTPVPWKGLVTDSRIQFKLVKITRTKTASNGFTFDDMVKKAATGRHRPVPPKTHLNLWMCALTGGLLGYAQFPGGPAATDGVVINYLAFGTIGTAQPPFHKGRTAIARDRPLLQPAAHLGGHAGLQRLRHGGGHAECRRTEHRHADVPAHHLQQRTEWRHVRQLHGLHRRCRDVHVHGAAGPAHAHGARHAAERAEIASGAVVPRKSDPRSTVHDKVGPCRSRRTAEEARSTVLKTQPPVVAPAAGRVGGSSGRVCARLLPGA